MNDTENRLNELNQLAEKVYKYVENGGINFTRRRLLLLQQLLNTDTNTNAVHHLLKQEPLFTDGAEMILRSMYDLSVNVDWIIKDRTNKRFWRWSRDDRKTLFTQLTSLVKLKHENPKLNTKEDPVEVWDDVLKKTEDKLISYGDKSGVDVREREVSLYAKAKTFGVKSQNLYHTLFWLFSTKTHASPTGLQDLITINPLQLRRRTKPATQSDWDHASILMRTGLLWYSAQIYRIARYYKTPFIDEAKVIYKSTLKTAPKPDPKES